MPYETVFQKYEYWYRYAIGRSTTPFPAKPTVGETTQMINENKTALTDVSALIDKYKPVYACVECSSRLHGYVSAHYECCGNVAWVTEDGNSGRFECFKKPTCTGMRSVHPRSPRVFPDCRACQGRGWVTEHEMLTSVAIEVERNAVAQVEKVSNALKQNDPNQAYEAKVEKRA